MTDYTKYCVFDVETTYGKYLGRVGSPFSNGEICLCASGFDTYNRGYTSTYLVHDHSGTKIGEQVGSEKYRRSFSSLQDVDVLVGHNIKFDLLWYWKHPELEEFLKRGGVIWDTAYAEYLLTAQFYNLGQQECFRPSLANCAKRRGLTLKLDIVAAMWDKGIRTEDVPEEVLMEYLQGDCQTTKELYLEQIAQAKRQNQLHMIAGRMEGLLATTEIEHTGLMIDLDTAEEQMETLKSTISGMEAALDEYKPVCPEGLVFNWASAAHMSALLFGGKIKYKAKADILDDKGRQTYYQKTVKVPLTDEQGLPVVFKSGKNAGKQKTQNVTGPDIDRGPKQRFEDFYHELPGQTKPNPKWKGATEGQYSVGVAVLEELSTRDIPLVQHLLKLRGAKKDLGTYYMATTNKGEPTGMLTMVHDNGLVHPSFNHTVALTTRLSCNAPNLMNIPKKGKSEIRKLFKSRFGGNGLLVEIDYSQLEVVCKGVLSGDEALLQALADNVDFHCDWLSLAPQGMGKSYDEIKRLCKVEHDPTWSEKRSKIKPLTFGEQFGAGIPKLAESTGMTAEEVEAAIKARKAKYPKMYQYDDDNIEKVKASRKTSSVYTADGLSAGIGYLRSVTDTIFHFVEGDSPDWMKHRGIMTSFMPTTIKNYPSQGLGGEIMQVSLGRVYRWLLANNFFDGNVALVNTVHDCVWIDLRKDYQWVIQKIKEIMEDVSPYFNAHYPKVNWDTPFPVSVEVGPNMFDLHAI